MKKYLLLLIGLTIISCGGDDSDESDDSEEDQTFLEKYDGVGFVSADSGNPDYVFFSDSTRFLKLAGQIDTEDSYCQEFQVGQNTNDEGVVFTISIVTNDANSLLVEAIYGGEIDRLYYTVDSSGNILTQRYLDEEIIETYVKTNITFNSLCN